MDLADVKASLCLKDKFNRDVLWNVGSLAVLGVSGIVNNIVIANYANAEALGIFNQVFAIYIMLSQICVGGLHFSVLKNISHNQDDRQKCIDIASSALLLAIAIAGVVCTLTYLLRDLAGALLDSPSVSVGIALAAPGLAFFSLNKILLNVLNGVRRMRAFAVFQALRFIFILAAVCAILAAGLPGEKLAFSLTVSECLLFLILIVYVNIWVFPLKFSSRVKTWFAEHLSFGFRGFFSGFLSEMNTRVDLLMLGYFCDDETVGIYSFAALLAEGLAQLPLVIRRNVDPILGRCFAENDNAKMKRAVQKVKWVTYAIMVGIGITAVLLYPIGLKLLVAKPGYEASWPIFAILMLGITLNSGYRPFLGIMLQGGKPGTHTFFITAVVGSNVILNAILIPLLGMYGAASATAIVYLFEAVLIVLFANKLFKVNL